jgi:phosphatidylserine/phosphatidylglycerophosphate/cardiolipin synthase-like enzyme
VWKPSSVTRLLLVACLLSATLAGLVCPGAAIPATAGGPDDSAEPAAILAVYPDPVREDDAGEAVHIRLPTEGNWTLSDGETTVRLDAVRGQVVVGSEPELLRERFPDRRVVAAPIRLSNGGEALILRRNGERVDRAEYGNAREGHRYLPNSTEWRPRGFTPREATPVGPANATTFLLPDSPGVPLETLRSADSRLLVAGYTFSSRRVAAALVGVAKRGVDVRVLVEANPVGGISRRQARVLDRLVEAGVEVQVIGVGVRRYAFHHPKYAVVDDQALVVTENWKPSGTGGRSSRGWGVRVDGGEAAEALAAVYAHDAAGPDTQSWSAFRPGRTFEPAPPANGSYPTAQPPEQVSARNVTLLTAPGNAESAVLGYINDAEKRIDVIQPTLGRQENELVEATLRAARRGVEVRILLSGAWYTAEENAALVTWLEDWAERTDAPLSVKLAQPGGRYEKIHAKGLLVDDEVAVVGSLNWNRNSARENREVAFALHGPEPVAYYRRAFEADWEGGTSGRRWLYAAGAVAAVIVAGIVTRRTLSFAEVSQ